MTKQDHIRNFSIIAHIDHGKSTLSDRLIELCGAVSQREMESQLLDNMDLEKERGITIKARAVKLNYPAADGSTYELNLIDTPGHVDFGPEAERALGAMDCGVLLLDASSAVSARAVTLFKLLRRWKKPVFFFLNKMDMEGASVVGAMESIRNRLTENVIFLLKGKRVNVWRSGTKGCWSSIWRVASTPRKEKECWPGC